MAFRENKHFLLLSSLLFIIPMFIGYFFAGQLEQFLQPKVETFKNRVQSGEIKLTMDSIFFNNFFVAIILYFGAILLGLITAINLISNGLFLGYYATTIPLDLFLIFTVPHGIFEIPGIIIAGAGGFTMFSFIYYFLDDLETNEKNQNGETIKLREIVKISYKNNYHKLSQSLALMGVATVLLIIAAFIEVYITVDLGKYLLGVL